MDEKVRAADSSYDYGGYDGSGYEWRWWHNVLGIAIVLAIVAVMSW
jgi:hypothetical protein